MTVSHLFKTLRSQFERETALFDLSQLFDKYFGKNARIMRPDDEVSAEVYAAITADFEKLKSGYPLQYIIGEWDFFGLTFKVGEGVLIPRADTEISVETALSLLNETVEPKIADFCSGTGAIALALANNLPKCEILALELYDKAYSYLCENIAALDKNGFVKPIKADVLGEFDIGDKFDLIISNPPYITCDEMKELSAEVKCEPETALFGGDDGLKFYRGITAKAKNLLKPGGWLVFEAGWKQYPDIAEIMRQNGFEQIASAKDLSGIDRCVYGQLKR